MKESKLERLREHACDLLDRMAAHKAESALANDQVGFSYGDGAVDSYHNVIAEIDRLAMEGDDDE